MDIKKIEIILCSERIATLSELRNKMVEIPDANKPLLDKAYLELDDAFVRCIEMEAKYLSSLEQV